MNTTIYYFTGTGNSLFVAQKLAAAIECAELVPMLSLLNQQTPIAAPKRVGLIFPIYQSILPLAVKQAMACIDFSDSEYIFAIATRAGTTHRAFETVDTILRPQGKALALTYSVNMANNDPKFKYVVPTKDELQKIETATLEAIGELANQIQTSQHLITTDQNYTLKTPLLGLLATAARMTEHKYEGFYHDERCTGCGLCQKVCTSQKITMQGNEPVWNKKTACYKCSACLNYCPTGAVQLKHFTEKNGRYSHPYATAEVIEKQRIDIRE